MMLTTLKGFFFIQLLEATFSKHCTLKQKNITSFPFSEIVQAQTFKLLKVCTCTISFSFHPFSMQSLLPVSSEPLIICFIVPAGAFPCSGHF